LKAARWNVKAAIVMKKAGVSLTQALRRLRRADDSIRKALGEKLEPRLRMLLDEPKA
jgi:N-acetylmuramic acid 6-phosphate (MurNAc-6-P) etherase